jgi:hypothetical protein
MGLIRNEAGQFKEGSAGRPPGATNKTGMNIKKYLVEFLEEQAYELPIIWNELSNQEKAQLYTNLCRLVLPKNVVVKDVTPLQIEIIETSDEDEDEN